MVIAVPHEVIHECKSMFCTFINLLKEKKHTVASTDTIRLHSSGTQLEWISRRETFKTKFSFNSEMQRLMTTRFSKLLVRFLSQKVKFFNPTLLGGGHNDHPLGKCAPVHQGMSYGWPQLGTIPIWVYIWRFFSFLAQKILEKTFWSYIFEARVI